jgi:hypothetical protein
LYPAFKALGFEMAARNFGVFFISLNRFHVSSRSRSMRQPETAVSQAASHFEQPFGLRGSR